jgi:hypothetical protein
MMRAKIAVTGITGLTTTIAALGVSIADVKEALQIGALLGGIAVSIYTLRRLKRQGDESDRLSAIQTAKTQAEMCAECKKGVSPTSCPIPTEQRPFDCPQLGRVTFSKE